MRHVASWVASATLLLALSASQLVAGAQVPASDAAVPADAPATGAPAPAVAAPPVPLVALREDVGRHLVRLEVGQDRYELRRARLEPAGIAFDPGDLRGLPSRPAGGGYWQEKPAPALASPIGWDRVQRIQTQHSNLLRGAVVGSLLAVGMVAAIEETNPDDTVGFFYAGAVPALVLGGAAIGVLTHHWKQVWRRPTVAVAAR